MKKKLLNYLPFIAVMVIIVIFIAGCEQDALPSRASKSEISLTQINDTPSHSSEEVIVDFIQFDGISDDSDEYLIGVGIRALSYRIETSHPKAGEFVDLIKMSNQGKKPNPLKITVEDSYRIVNVEQANTKEVSEWKKKRESLSEISVVDELPFIRVENIEDLTNKQKIQQLFKHDEEKNNSVIFSNYSAIEDAFDDIETHTCDDNENSYEYGCISFAYKRDGCYARAHKMKYLLEMDFNKTCYKIFVFSRGHRLNVPGCSLKWRYHVAPIVYSDADEDFYVLDPSLGNTPMTMGDWASIMDIDKICAAEIRHGSYYGASFNGNKCDSYTYEGDFDYSHTNWTLWNYQNYFGCYQN